MENSIKIIKQIERTHSGLGIPILFGNLCNLAGVSCFFIGEMGTGKGTIIKAIKRLSNVDENLDMNIFTLNITTLIKQLGDIKGKNIIWRVPEWSTLQPYHRNIFLTIGSEIITDHNFFHQSRTKDEEVQLHIENCNLTCFVGIQPLKLGRMMNENENWESIAKDRFMKFAMMNPLRHDTVEIEPVYNFQCKLGINEIVPIKSQLTVMKICLNDQASEDRLITYCRKLLVAYCKVEGYDMATLKAEIEFKQLFGMYLKLFSLLSFTADIDKEEKFAVGTLRLLSLIVRHNPISLYDVMSKFKYQDIQDRSFRKVVLNKADILERAKLIQIGNSEPTFTMSKELETFYNWYREISQ